VKIRLGYWDKTCKDPLSYAGDAHGILCSPTRRGKFSCVLCQMLLTAEHSCFVIDPKGQAAAVTGRYRRDVLKQDVYLLNPFNILPEYLADFKHAQYDPIASKLDPDSETFEADADNLAEGCLPTQATSAIGSIALASSWPVWRCI
jgi:type IV secretory pathway TraG/TraD family ATPase VirD4